MKKQMKQGFTLVEIMIVVAIIGLLAAIAIPSFVKSRDTTRKNTCISNMRLLDSAKEQFAIDQNTPPDGTVAMTNLLEYLKGGEEPICPQGTNVYFTSITVSNVPTCPNVSTYADHVL
jgi:prepilin-type N-terminal cleavage/methylation domain-containing protein